MAFTILARATLHLHALNPLSSGHQQVVRLRFNWQRNRTATHLEPRHSQGGRRSSQHLRLRRLAEHFICPRRNIRRPQVSAVQAEPDSMSPHPNPVLRNVGDTEAGQDVRPTSRLEQHRTQLHIGPLTLASEVRRVQVETSGMPLE
jgi:hypothetical protein